MAVIALQGRVVTGQGVAQHYTREAWARAAFMKVAGIDPFPGTLNLSIADCDERRRWISCRGRSGFLLPAPSPSFCDGRLFRASVTGRGGERTETGAVVVPMVPGYPEDQLEIIAVIGLRDALGVDDGDDLMVRIDLAG